MFRSYQAVALLTGAGAGVILAIEAGVPRGGIEGYWYLFALLLLVSTPAIALRFPVRLLLRSIVLCILAIPFIILFSAFFSVNGRLTMPLVVWNTPGVFWTVPGRGSYWQWRAVGGFAIFWLIIDIVQVWLRCPARSSLAELLQSLTRRRLRAIALSLLPVIVLYPISWRAKVGGTFVEPLYTDFEYYFSLTVFFLIFPLKQWWLHFLLDRVDLRQQHANKEGRETETVREETT